MNIAADLLGPAAEIERQLQGVSPLNELAHRISDKPGNADLVLVRESAKHPMLFLGQAGGDTYPQIGGFLGHGRFRILLHGAA
jgi:hypothetical protein